MFSNFCRPLFFCVLALQPISALADAGPIGFPKFYPQTEMGTEIGNGGDVIVCEVPVGQPSRPLEILDFYEARVLRGIHYDLGGPELSVEEKVDLAISRLNLRSPKRAEIYRNWANEFMAEALFAEEVTLDDIPDSDIPSFPQNCFLKQIAIQRKPIYPEDKRYLIDKGFWDQLDNDNKAGLILHEIIYREAIQYGQNNSRNARYFNSYISSHAFEELKSQDAYAKFMKLIHFRFIEALGLIFSEIELYPNGKVKTGNVISGVYMVQGQSVDLSQNSISFFESGAVRELTTASKLTLQILGNALTFGGKYGTFEFYESGGLKKSSAGCESGPQLFKTPSYKVWIACDTTFHESGHIAESFSGKGFIKTGLGKIEIDEKPSYSYRLKFDTHGRLLTTTCKGTDYPIGGQNQRLLAGSCEFYESGALKHGAVSGKFSVSGIAIETGKGGIESQVRFFPSGAVQSMYLRDSTILYSSQNRLRAYGSGDVTFDEMGRVDSGNLEANSDLDVISLTTRLLPEVKEAVRLCASDFAKKTAQQVFSGECSPESEFNNFSFEEDTGVYHRWSGSYSCFTALPGKTRKISFIPESYSFSGVDSKFEIRFEPDSGGFQLLQLNKGLPVIKFTKRVTDLAYDSFGNILDKKVEASAFVIRSPSNFAPVVYFTNPQTDVATGIAADLKTYRDCLQTRLFGKVGP